MSVQAKLQLESEPSSRVMTSAQLKPILEALIYVAEEPISEAALISLVGKEHQDAIHEALQQLLESYRSPECGLEIKEISNGFKMATKAEHHEWVRKYVKHQTPPTKLSLAALETLAVIAYKQPITVPEIQEVRGVNAVAVLKTLLDRKLITTAGRKNVIGRPILYRTAKEFLIHFGLKNLEELPSLEEFEELARSAVGGSVESEGETLSGMIREELVSPALQLEAVPGMSDDRDTGQDAALEIAASRLSPGGGAGTGATDIRDSTSEPGAGEIEAVPAAASGDPDVLLGEPITEENEGGAFPAASGSCDDLQGGRSEVPVHFQPLESYQDSADGQATGVETEAEEQDSQAVKLR